MADAQLGLKIAFYAYPCVIFLTLLGVQSLQFYLSRRRESRPVALDNDQKQKAEAIKRFYARLIWILQLALSIILLVTIVLAVREALTDQHVTGTITFSFSAYLVKLTIPTRDMFHSLT